MLCLAVDCLDVRSLTCYDANGLSLLFLVIFQTSSSLRLNWNECIFISQLLYRSLKRCDSVICSYSVSYGVSCFIFNIDYFLSLFCILIQSFIILLIEAICSSRLAFYISLSRTFSYCSRRKTLESARSSTYSLSCLFKSFIIPKNSGLTLCGWTNFGLISLKHNGGFTMYF